ncbi:hypothetical protein BDV25DRAFT_143578 [Aspergillus avenaceus]|uniref:Polyketide synthase n=1 Tax=Aspergillus avenaceus TaxID=36643 RepID=A0A5N6TJN0_ASPAV|nr:hypothetical protein BDV25DRAFT_143578 [Aspergillus avenaceus]
MSRDTILLFGPQALAFDEKSFSELRDTVLNDAQNRWVIDAVSQLPARWESFVERFPKLKAIDGSQMLQNLNNWLSTGQITSAARTLPNVLLSPLVVISQLTQYIKYLQLTHPDATKSDDIYSITANAEAIGFCTGQLSALTVSSATNQAQFEQNATTAVLLATLVGGFVDAQEIAGQYKESKSFATVWNSPSAKVEMTRTLNEFPEAYVSVSYDENRATVTTAASSAASLQGQLRAAGIIATELNLCGRFHCDCYNDDIQQIMDFCDSESTLQFPDASKLVVPIRSNDGSYITAGKLHHFALRSILVEQSQWYQAFSAIRDSGLDKKATVVGFGPERCVPPSLLRSVSQQVVYMLNPEEAALRLTQGVTKPQASLKYPRGYSDNDIAVVGYSLKVAGADDSEEFWQLLCEGKSQHVEIPQDKISFETHWRKVDPKRKWFGNFINDPEAFDHKFFKKSPREVASQDPQQRLMMQVAYQAVEQSGYFNSPNADPHVGCYIGVCATDYENNVACHEPNAFSATGNLRSFIAGKISHYFGWTGPGLTIDSACSASAVSIHMAARAILGGECTAALAGGVNVMTNPLWFQNLAGASFLSQTGPCKPFDAKADGYCRGEGIAAVFIKKMSQAVLDGDVILGCIASTAVYQNENCTPIFVPNSPSLSGLFADVTRNAGIDASQVTVAEAHGTGTPVGDPAEYESILRVFGGSIRQTPMNIGSVKGLVGHTEGASGVIALIKIMLMIQEGKIPPQASFQTLNPHIKASPSDMLEIATSLKDWNVDYRAALINNYGASGSNASLLVAQPVQHDGAGSSAIHSEGLKHPFWLTGLDEKSIRQYATKLRDLIRSKNVSSKNMTIANVSFNHFRQSNRNLDKGLIFSANSLSDLDSKLTGFINKTDSDLAVASKKAARPIILCFGGQVSTFIGLDRKVYDGVRVLRGHLDHCNSVIQALGLKGIYPDIFQKNPIEDTVQLQTMLFATQYSVAKTWVDSGVEIAAVVGHSFGELTALCVSGALSVHDALKAISARAQLVRDQWGSDRGSMMAVEGDLDVVQKLLNAAHSAAPEEREATIACYNGPRSFTLAGSTKAIDAVVEKVAEEAEFSSMRTKRLNVTNAFHSTLVEPLLDDLKELGKTVTFNRPSIHMERAIESPSSEPFSSEFFANHMRNPVCFNHAVQRLAKQHPSAIFLEAGSNSTITVMASRALGAPAESHFQAVNLMDGGKGLDALADMSVSLWKEGLKHIYWPHHTSQTYEYGPVLMPAYQFEKSKHWLEPKKPQQAVAEAPAPVVQQAQEELPKELYTFVGYQDSKQRIARFRVNTMIKKYEDLVSGHMIANTAPICPATLEMGIVIEALYNLQPALRDLGHLPRIHDVENQAPVCVDPSRAVWLDLENSDADSNTWGFKLLSTGSKGPASTQHVSGKIICQAASDPQYEAEFRRYERLVGHKRCVGVLTTPDADDIIQGRNIYKTFADVVDYGQQYRGLQKLVGKGNESAGRVIMKHGNDGWLDVHLTDSFSQVGGIWVNCMTDRPPTDMYIAAGFEQWIRSPKVGERYNEAETWDVYAYHHHESEKAYTTDIFIFESATGTLAEVILGIHYAKVSKQAMSKMLARLTPGVSQSPAAAASPSKPASVPVSAPVPPAPKRESVQKAPKPAKKTTALPDLTAPIKAVLADLSGLEVHEIEANTGLADIGIDSLMGMEMAKELEQKFKCSIPEDNLVEVTTVQSLIQCVQAAVGPVETSVSDEDDESSASSVSNDELSDSATSVSGDEGVEVNVAEFLAEFLGVGEDEINDETLLRDLGVDSLLSTELLADLASKFGLHLPEDTMLEELTVKALSEAINGKPASSSKPSSGGSGSHGPTPEPVTAAAPAVQAAPKDGNLHLSSQTVLEAFNEVKKLTDQYISDYGCADYMDVVNPKQVQMCVALIVEAFEELGCPLRTMQAGQKLERVKYLPQHSRLADYLYMVLERDGRLIDVEGDTITRTHVAVPSKASNDLLEGLMQKYPSHHYANKLTYFTGKKLADVLTGKSDGIKLIFGTEEGRELVSGLYGDSLLNKLSYKMMEDFLKTLIAKLPMHEGPLKILEMGAGTGGTTKLLVPVLESLNIPVEYTYTDLSPSFTAAARKKFKHYPFMKFRVHDIEKPPADDLLASQHIIIASNAVHATHNLDESTKNIRKALRPDGFLMMLEMTETLVWIDVIFGLLEGWWLFEDGRRHAIAHQSRWERVLQSVGYGHVDWTDGNRPEVEIQRVIIAMASGQRYDRLSIPPLPATPQTTDTGARQATVDEYVRKHTHGFTAPTRDASSLSSNSPDQRVLLTGATGSLGSHLVHHFANLPNVKSVICINRPTSSQDPEGRQRQALDSRGIQMSPAALAKLKVLETDTSKPLLGLSREVYDELTSGVTHILHNAWPMSGKRPVRGFEQQFKVMRNLLDLARDISGQRAPGFQVSFQFISSIATVGHYPYHTGKIDVPEERMTIDSVLPNGYGDAKYICERMLDETLHRFPEDFRVMAVRLGQVAGSKTSGYWNPLEHLSFLIKSSQTLRALPDFDGLLSWTPVNDVAATLSDLLVGTASPYPIYHIDNPVRQEWKEMIPVLADSLGVPRANVVPFPEWVKRVRTFPGSVEVDNPAYKLIEFLDGNFLRMSCGGLLLETKKAREHSPTLAGVGPVSAEVARKFISAWRESGFLY